MLNRPRFFLVSSSFVPSLGYWSPVVHRTALNHSCLCRGIGRHCLLASFPAANWHALLGPAQLGPLLLGTGISEAFGFGPLYGPASLRWYTSSYTVNKGQTLHPLFVYRLSPSLRHCTLRHVIVCCLIADMPCHYRAATAIVFGALYAKTFRKPTPKGTKTAIDSKHGSSVKSLSNDQGNASTLANQLQAPDGNRDLEEGSRSH